MTSYVTRAFIDLSACRHNLSVAKKSVPDSKCISIIKANAYGHGIVEIAKALTSSDAFGVARLSEAMQLRNAGIETPILLLEGFSSADELEIIQKNDFDCVIYNEEQLLLLEKNHSTPLNIILKIDSGMHRLGFNPNDIVEVSERLQKCVCTIKPFKVMTHLANADDKEDDFTLTQIERFYKSIETLPSNEKSIANSAGILGWPQSHSAWIRPGIMLYGVSPFVNSSAELHNLKPVMTFSSRLISIKEIKKGESIGYGGTFTCERDMRVGVVAVGYGDGYPRHAKTGTPVLINGQRCRLLGRVSMDMICVDLSQLTDAVNINDNVILWGEGLPIEEVAECSSTIGYELLCGVTKRVEFIYQ